MRTLASRPESSPLVDEETRRIIEERLATADDAPWQDLAEAVEEIRARREPNRLSSK